MARKEDFDRKVPLPSGLTTTAIQKAIDYIEKGLADLVEIYFEQANVFSALVGIFGAKALDATSVCFTTSSFLIRAATTRKVA